MGRGGGWAKKEKKLSLFLGPPAGVLSRRQSIGQEGLCPPFAQRSLPAQARRWEIYCFWPRRRPMNGYREDRVEWGGWRKSPRQTRLRPPQGLPSSLGLGTGRPKKILGPHVAVAGGIRPLVSTLPPFCALPTYRNSCSQPKASDCVFTNQRHWSGKHGD